MSAIDPNISRVPNPGINSVEISRHTAAETPQLQDPLSPPYRTNEIATKVFEEASPIEDKSLTNVFATSLKSANVNSSIESPSTLSEVNFPPASTAELNYAYSKAKLFLDLATATRNLSSAELPAWIERNREPLSHKAAIFSPETKVATGKTFKDIILNYVHSFEKELPIILPLTEDGEVLVSEDFVRENLVLKFENENGELEDFKGKIISKEDWTELNSSFKEAFKTLTILATTIAQKEEKETQESEAPTTIPTSKYSPKATNKNAFAEKLPQSLAKPIIIQRVANGIRGIVKQILIDLVTKSREKEARKQEEQEKQDAIQNQILRDGILKTGIKETELKKSTVQQQIKDFESGKPPIAPTP